MSDRFELDPRLTADCHTVIDLQLSRVLLMNDSRFPWLILVPRLPALHELADLDRSQQHRLLEEISAATRALEATGRFDKLNIGALGNIVSQLHVHVIARRIGDAAWPAPVWGHGMREPYADPGAMLQRLRDVLAA